MARLKDFYKDSVVKSMTEQFGYTSVTVSYTHLDVYKRQPILRIMKGECG